MAKLEIPQLSLLLFDDCEDSAEKSLQAFRGLGITDITYCFEPEEVRTELILERRDLVVVDLDSSFELGADLIESLREPQFSAISPAPILAIINSAHEVTPGKAMAAGACGTMVKPFLPDDMIAAMQEVMSNRIHYIQVPDYRPKDQSGLPGEFPFLSEALRLIG